VNTPRLPSGSYDPDYYRDDEIPPTPKKRRNPCADWPLFVAYRHADELIPVGKKSSERFPPLQIVRRS
jgi:hypothetical protein